MTYGYTYYGYTYYGYTYYVRHLLAVHGLALGHLEAAALEAWVERELEARWQARLGQLPLQQLASLRLGDGLDELRRLDQVALYPALPLDLLAMCTAAAQVFLDEQAVPSSG